ncbi:MAG: type II toxin-antitoxin system VapC family toxin [Candidatus Bathyarchaeia archaeon]
MNYLFEASSVFKALMDNIVEALAGGYTLELARYGLGNILWKEYAIRQRAKMEEIRNLARLLKQVLSLMKTLTIDCHEEGILDMAGDLRITFYDASYVYYAKKNGMSLVTEDQDLIEKAKPYIKALKLKDIL